MRDLFALPVGAYAIIAAGDTEWVNPSKRGGMDGVFRGLAGLLRGISRGKS